jgi:ABC-type transport system substrate-binding protein
MAILDLPPRTLRVGLLSQLGTLKPWEIHDSSTASILEQVFETPYAPPFSSEVPAPLLLTEPLKREADPLVFSAPVRQGVVFSDGTPCSAAAIVRSLLQASDFVSRATAVSRDTRIEFRLKHEDANFPVYLTQSFYGVGRDAGGTVVGTGPFLAPQALDGTDPQKATKLVVRANPKAWKAPAMEAVYFEVFPDVSALISALQAERIHLTYALTQADMEKVRGGTVQARLLEGTSTGVLFLNTERPALRDVRTRRALCAAVNRTEVAKALHGPVGVSHIATGLLPPFMRMDAKVGKPEGSLAEAKGMVTAERLALPKSMTLLLTWSPKPYCPDPRLAGETIAKQLGALGIDVDIVAPKDRKEYTTRQVGGDYDLVLSGWIADTPVAADYLDSLLKSTSVLLPTITRAAANNLARWRSMDADKLLASFRADPSPAILGQLMQLVEQQAVLVPLTTGKFVVAQSSKVRGFRPSALARSSFRDVSLGT